MNDVLDHVQQETTATTAYTKQDLACNDKKEGHLKDGVDIFKNRLEMMV
jgi:hypothetical protein